MYQQNQLETPPGRLPRCFPLEKPSKHNREGGEGWRSHHVGHRPTVNQGLQTWRAPGGSECRRSETSATRARCRHHVPDSLAGYKTRTHTACLQSLLCVCKSLPAAPSLTKSQHHELQAHRLRSGCARRGQHLNGCYL